MANQEKEPNQSFDEFINSKRKPLSKSDAKEAFILLYKKLGAQGDPESYADEMVKIYVEDRLKCLLASIKFQDKNPSQKNNCINLLCSNVSILEAVCRVGENISISIRCCTNKECKKLAEQMAREDVERAIRLIDC